MIRVTVSLSGGLPVRFYAEGHGRRGQDGLSAACAAVSAILKGLGVALVEQSRCFVTGSVETEGRFDLHVSECSDELWLQGLWDLTRTTLHQIAREWPGEVIFTIIEENSDGT